MSNTFNLKTFQEVFDSYFWKWWCICSILYISLFGIYAVAAIGLLTTETELPSFLYRFIAPFEYAGGMADIPIGGREFGFLTFGAVSVGIFAIGAVSVGIFAIGAFSVGVFAIGAFSMGIFAFGGNAVGIIAIGSGTSLTGYFDRKASKARGRFDIGKAVGVVAISPEAYGVYTLSYSGSGAFSFSPSCQDVVAVSFFSRWLPKFKRAFHSPG